MSFRPVDETARERARRDAATSLVLEAGAGTGKTTLLVDRIEHLVRSGHARLDEIAAVTFTENAATVMKLRLRERLELARMSTDGAERIRTEAALEVLERAQVSTIHSLCAALLQERPLECGVTPAFRVADEARADLLFAEAWEEWLADALQSEGATLAWALDEGIQLEGDNPWRERTSLRGLARRLVDQRDLEPLVDETPVDLGAYRIELLAAGARAEEFARGVPEADTLASGLGALACYAEMSRGLEGRALQSHLLGVSTIRRNLGRKDCWPDPRRLDEARQLAAWTSETPARWKTALGAALHGRLMRTLGGMLDRYAAKKSEAGLLDFLDLLVLARQALRSSEAVRDYFQARFRYLIIDEFQDTDRLQVDVATLLAGDRPGALVVVGDAKQSIYRFRRADVRLFRALAEAARDSPGRSVLSLSQNFRSQGAILRFVNRVFGEIMQASLHLDQPAYEPIAAPPGLPEGPAVLALRFDIDGFASGEDLLIAEAGALARLVVAAARGTFTVRDPADGAWRPSRAGDVLVLSRRLTQIRYLEDAFDLAGIAFAVEGGKSFFDRQEVHDSLAVLRAIDDASDRVSLVAALRSAFFGVSDRDIAAYALAGGRLWLGEADESLPGGAAIAEAYRVLADLRGARLRISVPALIERLYDETRILAALTGTRRGEAKIANLEKVATLARQATALGAFTLRAFVRLLEERIDSAREEPDLPSTRPGDPATVRVLSIHKAKGLEAPIVALYDTADNLAISADAIPLWEEGRIAVGFKEGCQPPGWAALKLEEDARTRAESARLLYVACTRARDLLVIPKPPGTAQLGDFWKPIVSRLPDRDDADVRVVDAATLPSPVREPPPAESEARSDGGDAVAARWDAERAELLERAARRSPRPISVTRVANRLAPPPVAAVAAETGGRDFGRLVHRILEWAPLEADQPTVRQLALGLAPTMGLGAAEAAQAEAEVLRVLALPLLERARRAVRLWREMPLWMPEGDELVEGIADLVFLEASSLVLVDYKTDRIAEGQALAQAGHHAPQLQLYARGLAQALGNPVQERLVVFTALARTVQV